MRHRRLAAWVLIFTLALSVSEAFGAALCRSGMPMADMPGPANDSHAQHSPSGDTNDAPACPYSMPGSLSTCVFSFAVAPTAQMALQPAWVIQGTAVTPIDAVQRLIASSLFHPPKA